MWRMTRCSMSTPRRGGVYWRRRSLNPSPSTSLLRTLPSPSSGCSSAPASDSSIFILWIFQMKMKLVFSLCEESQGSSLTLQGDHYLNLFLILPYLKLSYFRSGFNCYLRLWTYSGKPGYDIIAVLFLDLSTPTGGTLKINFSTEKMNYLVCFRYFGDCGSHDVSPLQLCPGLLPGRRQGGCSEC